MSKLKKELASPSAAQLETPDRWAPLIWACGTRRAHLETQPAWRGISLSGLVGAQSVDLRLQVQWVAQRGLPEPLNLLQSHSIHTQVQNCLPPHVGECQQLNSVQQSALGLLGYLCLEISALWWVCKGLPTQALTPFPTGIAPQPALSALSFMCPNCLGRQSTGALMGATGCLSSVPFL